MRVAPKLNVVIIALFLLPFPGFEIGLGSTRGNQD
jgi:hypothetical protein